MKIKIYNTCEILHQGRYPLKFIKTNKNNGVFDLSEDICMFLLKEKLADKVVDKVKKKK